MSDLTSSTSQSTTPQYTPTSTPAESAQSSTTPTPLAGLEAASDSMDFPLIRRARQQGDHSNYINGMGVNGGIENRIPHSRERDLPGGANWVVQKFGGTSVGKFGRVIAEDIVA